MKKCLRTVVLLLIVTFAFSTCVSAAEDSNAYIRSGLAYIRTGDPGDICVEYNVTGTDIMDTIGAYRVSVYKALGKGQDVVRDQLVATYWHEDYPDMMTTKDVAYSHSIWLRADMGMKYYAVIIFYATLNGGGDDMAYCTSTVST